MEFSEVVVWRCEGGQSRQEVRWLKQELGGAIAKGTFERVDHEAVAVSAQAFERQRESGDVATQPERIWSRSWLFSRAPRSTVSPQSIGWRDSVNRCG